MLQVKYLFGQPNFLTNLSKLTDEEIRNMGLDFSEITFMTGGTVFNFTNTNEILSRTGAKAVVQIYGSTEVAGCVTFDNEDNFVPGSAGTLAPNM